MVALAGFGAAIGSCLTWVEATVPGVGSETWAGIQSDAGRFTLILGLLIALLGTLRMTGKGEPRRISLTLSLLCAGLTGVGVWQFIDVASAEQKVRASLSGSVDAAIAATIQVTVGTGLFVIVAAGVAGTIAALLSLRTR